MISIPRKDRRGGGVAVVVKEPISVKQNCPDDVAFHSFEHLTTIITHPQHSQPFNLCIVYRPPRSDKNTTPISVFFDEISELFTSICIKTGRLLITGDFIINVDLPEKPDVSQFLQIIESFGLKQHVNVPTHVAGYILDFVFTREDCDFLSCVPKAHFMMTSHSTILFSLNWAKPSRLAIVRTCRKIKAINLKKFQSDLQSSDLLQCPAESLDDLALQYQSTLSSVLEFHAPLVLIKVSQRPSQPWFCSEIAEAKKKRRRLQRRLRRTKLEIDRLSFIEARNNVCKLTSMAKTSFYSRRIDAFSCNQKALFREMNHLLNQSTVTPMPPHESPGVLANQFADYFSSKIDLIRRELNHCVPHSLLAPGTCSQTEMNINKFSAFDSVSIRTVSDLISSCPAKTCDLDPVPTRLLKDCSEQLAPAITSMINLSLSTGTLPSSWKDAIVLPSLKSGKKELIMENYRPISNLPFISKLCENVVAMQLTDHLLRNNLMEPILRRVPSRPGLRSLNNISLFVPKTISRADKSTADRAFSLSAPKLWNTLPSEIRNTRTIIDFKRKLKTFLFPKYF